MAKTNKLPIQIIITLAISLFTQSVYSQSSCRKNIYNAYINSDMNKWAGVIHSMESNNSPTTIDQKLELINYYYGYIGYLIGIKKNEQAQTLITAGEKLINKVLESSPRNVTALAYKGSYIGFQISMSKVKGISLASESISNINKAYETDPRNIQAIIDKANALYFAPSIFGGDKHEAIKLYLKSVNLMETSKTTDQNWTYLHVLRLLARAYEKQNKFQEAKLIYEKSLRKEPNFKLVKEILYPKILAKLRK
jgi:tetratricopeptide (TPR) repeat protein